MLTTIASSILSDPEAFEAAVKSFLTKMIEDCDINTEIPCRVDETIHILTANEVNLTCILSNKSTDEKTVQTEVNISEKVSDIHVPTDEKFVQTDDIHDEIELTSISSELPHNELHEPSLDDIEKQAVQQSVEIVYTHEQVRDALTILRQRQPDDMEIQAVKQSLEMGYTQEQVRYALTLLRQIKPGENNSGEWNEQKPSKHKPNKNKCKMS